MAILRTQSFSLAVLSTALLLNAVFAAEPTPMERVISLLTDLRTTVENEGVAEATTYDKFACWCKDTMAAKTKSITTGETDRDSLQAKINQASIRRDAADGLIASASASAIQVADGIDADRVTTKTQSEEISVGQLDLIKALQALDAAIQALSAAKVGTTGLLEVKAVPKAVRQALALVEILGSRDEAALRVVTSLALPGDATDPNAVDPNAIPVPATFAFHSDAVIGTLQGLKTEFNNKKIELDGQMTSLMNAHKIFQDGQDVILKGHEGAIVLQKKAKVTETDAIETASQDLSTTSAQLLDDQSSLSEVSAKCTQKAQLWDVRTSTRAMEMSAITQALAQITGFQATYPNSTAFLLATKQKVYVAGASSTVALSKPPAFVQLASIQRHLRGHSALPDSSSQPLNMQQELVVNMLRMKAETLKSSVLLKIATEVQDDPFAKVKGLIQDLIERLLKEQADEASHKGWCDKEVSVATIKRDKNVEAVEEENSKMEVAEARRAKLTMLVADLAGEVALLNETRTNSTRLRGEEKAENAVRVTTAKDGLDAVGKAIQILDRFYKTAAKQGASLSQKNASVVEPDAGFDDAYTGAQGAKQGVVGMLEVLSGDFQRTVDETLQAEAVAQQDFLELSTSLGKSFATQQVVWTDRDAALTAANADYVQAQTDLAAYLKSRDEALQQLKALYATCLASGGTSPEMKKAQREDELAALNQALCTLDQHGSGADVLC